MVLYLLKGLTLGLSAAATPGPFQAFLLAESARKGWQKTLGAAFAPLLSDGPIIALVLLLLTQMPAWFLATLKGIGALFILYLAWGAWQAYRRFDAKGAATVAPMAERQSLWKATTMNLLNPNPYIFWSAVGGQILLEAWALSPLWGVVFLLGIYSALIGGFMVLIYLFGAAGQMGATVNRAMIGISAVALALFGLYQLAMVITG